MPRIPSETPKPPTWDEERVKTILDELLPPNTRAQRRNDCLAAVTSLLASVRAEAIGWTWTEACSQYDRGLDPRRSEVPALLERAKQDLNPVRSK